MVTFDWLQSHLDLSGGSFLVDGALFNGILTKFETGKPYALLFEFEAVNDYDYKVSRRLEFTWYEVRVQ